MFDRNLKCALPPKAGHEPKCRIAQRQHSLSMSYHWREEKPHCEAAFWQVMGLSTFCTLVPALPGLTGSVSGFSPLGYG